MTAHAMLKAKRSSRVGYALIAAVAVAAVAGVRGPEAATKGCSFSSSSQKNSVQRVHAIPRGCLWLAKVGSPMPTLRVRQRDLRGRWHDRSFSFPVPEGFLGVCTANTGLLVVSYPFVTFAAGELEDNGGPPLNNCRTDFEGMAIWLARLSAAPRITVLWRTSG